jgi:hypothetical protein
MSTQKQVNANRQNAKKSTGPKTDKGKAAVSKNAVKHGLFAKEAVITGENAADYEAYRDEFLAEMKPVGAIETMLAERFVSLAWRLMRAQRMQNQAFEDYIENHVTNPLTMRTRVLTCHAQGIPLGDPRCTSGHLPLGRAAKADWGCCRVMERMFMYERRIELSMTRILHEFKKQQIMRRIEQQDISYDQAVGGTEALTGKKVNLKKQSQSPAFGRKSEARSSKSETTAFDKGNLKKQTQFPPDMMGATPFMTDVYGDLSTAGAGENKANKANQSQFQTHSAMKAGRSVRCSSDT